MGYIKENIKFFICVVMAGIFIYGRYFVDVTEMAKLNSSIAAYFWVNLGVLSLILDKLKTK